jgi:phosphate butyryltransferase
VSSTKFKSIADMRFKIPPKKVCIAAADDINVLNFVKMALTDGLGSFSLIGDCDGIIEMAKEVQLDLKGVRLIDQPIPEQAAQHAAYLAGAGEVDVVVKGSVNTADFLRGVLNPHNGLRTGRVLSHIGIFDIPSYDRLLYITDAGINIKPTFAEKKQIIQNAVELAISFGIHVPKVALLAAVETINPKMEATLEAAAFAKMADRGELRGAIVDGPLALDNAISKDAALSKGIKSEVAGAADILVVPNIEVGNVLVKSLIYFAGATFGGVVHGARVPIVLTSRADSAEMRYLSLIVACVSSHLSSLKVQKN